MRLNYETWFQQRLKMLRLYQNSNRKSSHDTVTIVHVG